MRRRSWLCAIKTCLRWRIIITPWRSRFSATPRTTFSATSANRSSMTFTTYARPFHYISRLENCSEKNQVFRFKKHLNTSKVQILVFFCFFFYKFLVQFSGVRSKAPENFDFVAFCDLKIALKQRNGSKSIVCLAYHTPNMWVPSIPGGSAYEMNTMIVLIGRQLID